MLRREGLLAKARAGGFDLVVVGGGITGAGTARDAARRGLKVLLVEQGDLAGGTSSRSAKLVHGGLRYLEQFKLGLVFESVSERDRLQRVAPHLVQPCPFLFPVHKATGKSPVVIAAGMLAYAALSRFRGPGPQQHLSAEQAREREPVLNPDGLRSAELYHDCYGDDARLTLESALDAVEHGGVVCTWTRLVGIRLDGSRRIEAVRLEDRLGGDAFDVPARVVVCAAGPWTDRVRALALGPPRAPFVRPTKGIHVVLDRDRLPVRHAVVFFHPRDHRVLFAIPWRENTYVGTTDTDWQGDPDRVETEPADVGYLLEAMAVAFPTWPVSAADIRATWAGLRPLISEEGVDTYRVSREHEVVVDPCGLVTVAGGKLTTFRIMAAEAVDRSVEALASIGVDVSALQPCSTEDAPLPGAVGWPAGGRPEDLAADLAGRGEGTVGPDTARLLVDTYGTRAAEVLLLARSNPRYAAPLAPGRLEILAQVDWAVTRELAVTLEDVLMRRIPLFLRSEDQGAGVAEAVARVMAERLGWTEDRVHDEVKRYHEAIQRNRRWRDHALTSGTGGGMHV